MPNYDEKAVHDQSEPRLKFGLKKGMDLAESLHVDMVFILMLQKFKKHRQGQGQRSIFRDSLLCRARWKPLDYGRPKIPNLPFFYDLIYFFTFQVSRRRICSKSRGDYRNQLSLYFWTKNVFGGKTFSCSKFTTKRANTAINLFRR